MSEGGVIMRHIRDKKTENTKVANEIDMTELREKCFIMSEYFLPVFEDFWIEEDKTVTEDVRFALFTNGLTFQIAFAVEHDLISVEGLSQEAIDDINEAHAHLVSLSG
jgi:Mg2+ and Co2+ transporter CorA